MVTISPRERCAPEEAPHIPVQPFTRKWMEWAEKVGPKLNPTARYILFLIASYANAQGQAIVTQDTLAYLADTSRQRVIDYIAELNRLKFIYVDKRDTRDGYRKYNVYTLACAGTDGKPTEAKGNKSALTTSGARFRELQDIVREATKKFQDTLTDHGIELDSIGVDFVRLAELCDTDTRERYKDISDLEGQLNGATPPHPENDHPEESQEISLSQPPVSMSPRGDMGHGEGPALIDPIEEFVDAHIDELVGDKPWQFNHRGGAIRTFQNSEAEWQRWIQRVKPLKSDAEEAPTEPEVETWDGEESDSEAVAIWERVKGKLEDRLPRPIFETWIRPTTGAEYSEDTFVVLAHSQFAAKWLQQRMFHALHGILQEETGAPVSLSIRVKSNV